MSMKRKSPRTYEADFRGKKVRVTVPERHETVAYSGDAAEVLRDVLRDNLSPQAVAVIAGHLHGMVNTKSDAVNSEVAWFTQQLLDMVGDQYNALCEEAGL
jgi:hypothetical protein